MPASIAAVGMVSSLGLDWATCCAAARAGISRAKRLDYFTFRTSDTGDLVPVVGHPVELLTKGFESYARLVRLLAGALKDLRRNAGRNSDILGQAKYYLSLPHAGRTFLFSELIMDAQTRKKYRDVENEACALAEASELERARRLVRDAATLAGWENVPQLSATCSIGHAGVAKLLESALVALSSGAAPAVVIGGVDSLLDEETLAWLLNTGRLKTPATAAGLMPGESAALLLLSRETESADTIISRVVCTEDGQPLSSGEPSTGVSLAQAITRAVGSDTGIPLLCSDHNGEPYRAGEFGSVLMRLRASYPWLASAPARFPAQAFGDTGAASGAVSLGILAGLWNRQALESSCSIVMSTSDGPQRAAIFLERKQVGP